MRFVSRRRVGIIALLAVPCMVGAWAWQAAAWRPKTARISLKPILALAWAGDGQTLRCASQDGGYRSLSGSTLQVLATSKRRGKWGAAQFSKDGGLLLVADLGGEEAVIIQTSSARNIWTLSFKSDNQERARIPDGGRLLIKAVGLSPSGIRVGICDLYAGAFDDSTEVKIFEPSNGGKKTGRPLLGAGECPSFMFDGAIRSALAFSPDENHTVVWKRLGVLALIDARTFKPIWTRKGVIPLRARTPAFVAADDLTEADFAPNGRVLAVQVAKDAVYLFNARDGACLRRCYLSGASVSSLVFSPDSRLLAVGDSRGLVHLFETGTGHLQKRIMTRTLGVRSLAFSPDGSRLAVGTATGQVQLWRVR